MKICTIHSPLVAQCSPFIMLCLGSIWMNCYKCTILQGNYIEGILGECHLIPFLPGNALGTLVDIARLAE